MIIQNRKDEAPLRTVGVIVEYNPLHNGHVYHFEQAKQCAEASSVIAVMSGHFLQRGEPAIVNKWARTEMALKMGADVVIELPIAYAMQSAEYFAYGAVSALHHSGVVDSLCFGSESDDLAPLHTLAAVLHEEPEAFRACLQQQLKTGSNYPTAYAAAIAEFAHHSPQLGSIDVELLAKPNNNLGLHYLIALKRLKSDIEPMIVPRHKAGFHQAHINDQHIASATALRRLISEAKGDLTGIQAFVPPFTLDIMNTEWQQLRAPMHWDRFVPQVMQRLLLHNHEQLAEFYEVSEGLEHRLHNILPQLNIKQDMTIEQLLEPLATKRYTRTKLQRMLLRITLNHKKETLTLERLQQGVPYLRVLGFSEQGRTLLRKMKTKAAVPIITNVTKHQLPTQAAQDFLELDLKATALYAYAYPQPTSYDVFRDYYEAPLRFSGNSSK